MAMRLNRGLAPRWFTPKSQQDQERPVRFQLKPLKGSYHMELASEFAGGSFKISEQQADEILQRSVIGWDGIEDETGAPLPCKPEYFELLPPDLVGAIIFEVMNSSSVSEDERKNSLSQSQ